MPAIIETEVFQIDELSGAAKDKARGWYRETGFDYDWHDFVYDDFERICEILGIELHTVPVRLFGGGAGENPVYGSRGSGAKAMGSASRATIATQKGRRRRSGAMRPKMPNFIASPMRLRGASGAISISSARASRTAAAIITNIVWTSRSSGAVPSSRI